MFSTNTYHKKFRDLLEDSNALRNSVEQHKDLPADIAGWLGRLKLLYGIPLNYLVPDECMLPPESIRFFYADPNWIRALWDGAFSIGREFDIKHSTRSFRMDAAATPWVEEQSEKKASGIRANFLGLRSGKMDLCTVSGFLLRSSLVADYPGIGVNAYPKGGTPSASEPGIRLTILRMEKLNPSSDTLICLIKGDAYRIDIHEAPEALHYGIDYYMNTDGIPFGRKKVYPFVREGDKGGRSVTMDMEEPIEINLEAGAVFRREDGGRTINMAHLARLIGKEASPDELVDSSEMGFEMTEGVGMVSFYNETNNEL